METDFRHKQKRGYNVMRMTYDLTMAVLMLGVGVIMVLAEKIHALQLIGVDSTFRYLFGGICFLYGGYRLYRGIKRDY